MRLFIALPLNDEAKNKISSVLGDIQRKLQGKNIRYMPPQNWHFTLVFLGDQPESGLDKIKSGLGEASENIEPAKVDMDRIIYGPPGYEPRMIWGTTKKSTSKQLGGIKGKIRNSLEGENINWDKDNRPYKGHLTLARFKFNEVRPLPDLGKELEVSYTPKRIQLMKSELGQEGAEYQEVESFGIA